MDGRSLNALLDAVARGLVTPGEAAERLGSPGTLDLGFARLDTHRQARTGVPEAVYAERKSPAQVREIVRAMLSHPGGPVVVTRAGAEHFAAVRDAAPNAEYGELGRTIVVRRGEIAPPGTVAIVTAGTSDLPVAEEAAMTAEALGIKTDRIADVGIAGVHRVLAVRERIASADVAIIVAGMDGALPSVVAGLVACPIVAVPTSVGYGAAFSGLAALLTMMNSCAPGVTVVNIDNGFGAAAAAARFLRER